jgi:hypothetical protein
VRRGRGEYMEWTLSLSVCSLKDGFFQVRRRKVKYF